MPTVGDRVLDNGLSALKAEATDVNINTVEPATYAAAMSGAQFLGKKTFGARPGVSGGDRRRCPERPQGHHGGGDGRRDFRQRLGDGVLDHRQHRLAALGHDDFVGVADGDLAESFHADRVRCPPAGCMR